MVLSGWIGFSEDNGSEIAEGANISPETFRGLLPTR
jgi:hypothetical protein